LKKKKKILCITRREKKKRRAEVQKRERHVEQPTSKNEKGKATITSKSNRPQFTKTIKGK